MQEFANNNQVAFGDVNLSEEPIRGNHNPGAGGWPTIKYFNQETGYEGRPYTQKTSGAMCDELGNEDNMRAYVEEAGSTSACTIDAISSCSEKEAAYFAKMKDSDGIDSQLKRLQGMTSGSMKPELKKWLSQRISILKQLATSGKSEL